MISEFIKPFGFSTRKLRTTFALRFTTVSFSGAVFGGIISAAFTDRIVGYFLKMGGISSFSSKLNWLQMVLPGMGVMLLFTLFAYASAGKIKKVDVKNLI